MGSEEWIKMRDNRRGEPFRSEKMKSRRPSTLAKSVLSKHKQLSTTSSPRISTSPPKKQAKPLQVKEQAKDQVKEQAKDQVKDPVKNNVVKSSRISDIQSKSQAKPLQVKDPVKIVKSPRISTSPPKSQAKEQMKDSIKIVKSPRISDIQSKPQAKEQVKEPLLNAAEELSIFIMELPAMEYKYKCPQCSYDTFKRTNFIHHQKNVHSKVYELLYQCIGCHLRYSKIRDCAFHTSHCSKISKIVDIQADKDKKNPRPKRTREPSSSNSTHVNSTNVPPKRNAESASVPEKKRFVDPVVSSLRLASSSLPTTSISTVPTSNWEILFFTELGRALVNNPGSAEYIVKVVPIIQQITKEVVSQLGNQVNFRQ